MLARFAFQATHSKILLGISNIDPAIEGEEYEIAVSATVADVVSGSKHLFLNGFQFDWFSDDIRADPSDISEALKLFSESWSGDVLHAVDVAQMLNAVSFDFRTRATDLQGFQASVLSAARDAGVGQVVGIIESIMRGDAVLVGTDTSDNLVGSSSGDLVMGGLGDDYVEGGYGG